MNKHIKNAKILSRINVAAGIWLILAPFMLGFSSYAAAMYNSIILGIVIGVNGLIRQSNPEESLWAGWTNIVLGSWLFISAFILTTGSTASIWNSIVLGALIVTMAASSLSSIRHLHHNY